MDRLVEEPTVKGLPDEKTIERRITVLLRNAG
jgi:hypothetical protein